MLPSTLKIPFLIANAYLSNKSFTPPSPPPPQEELVKDGERKIASIWPYILMAERVHCCFGFFHEMIFS
jgi:hypothetical protein